MRKQRKHGPIKNPNSKSANKEENNIVNNSYDNEDEKTKRTQREIKEKGARTNKESKSESADNKAPIG